MLRLLCWRPSVQFPRYEVSEHGDVRNARTKRPMYPRIDGDGYIRYHLRDQHGDRRSPAAHQLVILTYGAEKPSDQHQVAHLDGSRLHNHFSNLTWALPQENQNHKVFHGTSPSGERNRHAKCTAEDVLEIRQQYRAIKMGLLKKKVSSLAREYNLNHSTVLNIAKGKTWKCIPLAHADVLHSNLDGI